MIFESFHSSRPVGKQAAMPGYWQVVFSSIQAFKQVQIAVYSTGISLYTLSTSMPCFLRKALKPK